MISGDCALSLIWLSLVNSVSRESGVSGMIAQNLRYSTLKNSGLDSELIGNHHGQKRVTCSVLPQKCVSGCAHGRSIGCPVAESPSRIFRYDLIGGGPPV